MRLQSSIVALVLALSGGGSAFGASPARLVSDQRIVYSDGLHNENTEMIRFRDRILLIFRGGEEGQIGSARARIKVFESRDQGRTFHPLSEVNANNLPGGRDIRDPKLVEMGGRLFLYAISRVPGFHYRDLGGQAWTVRAESTDGGRTWTPPVKTYQDVDAAGAETFWGFWRYTKRTYTKAGKRRRTLFATGYQDFDTAVGLFASDDGITWEKRSTIIASYDDVPSEAELQFFGKNHEIAVALVRLDNQDILADGQTAICTSHEPFVTWECGRRIEQRLDGPTWIVRRANGRTRNFVFARKHLPCTFKRTAVYELRGDLTDPGAADRGVRDPGAEELGRHRLHLARAALPESVPAGLVQQPGRPGAAVVPGHLLAERHLARRRRFPTRARRLRRTPPPSTAASRRPCPAASAAVRRHRRASSDPRAGDLAGADPVLPRRRPSCTARASTSPSSRSTA